MSRYNSKREKKRGTEKVGILHLTGSIILQPQCTYMIFIYLQLLFTTWKVHLDPT